jgi:histidinol dehydrogenase
MIKILDTSTAKNSILKRVPPDEMPVPASLLDRIENLFGERITPAMAVDRIISDIRKKGDSALAEWTKRLDGVDLAQFRIENTERDLAWASLSEEQKSSLSLAAARVRKFHENQPVHSWMTQTLGGTIGQFIRPIRRVGLYIPSGSAPLPSTVLMTAIPAQVAGVNEIVLVAPPRRDTGTVDPYILAAASLLGIDEIYSIGGAQAIAALAYGTETIKPVDKIYGPGNLFVTLAKKQVFGVVGIDSLAGPTETIVIADETAKPAWVAADLLAQAEHDILASAILLTPSEKLAKKVQSEIDLQIKSRSRADVISASMENRSGIVITENIDEAIVLSNDYGPEHLCLALEDPWRWSEKVTSAGGVFLGEHSFEVLGDYIAGPSHVMPTGGSARFNSPLNVLDFVHIVSLVALDPVTTSQIAPAAAVIAHAEGLDAHAYAAEVRI